MVLPPFNVPRGSAATFLVALLTCGPLVVSAAPLSIDDAIQTAVHGNRDLHAARFAIDRARGRLQQAGLPPNPQLEVSTDSDLLFHNRGEYTSRIGVSQAFPMAGRLERQRDVARVDVDLAVVELRQAELKLAGEVAASLVHVKALDRQINLRGQLIDYDQHLATVTRNRFRAAEVSELDVNAAQLDLQRLNQERDALQTQRATQLSQLNQLMGRDAAQPITLAGGDDPPGPAPLPSLDELQRHALQARPDLRLALLGVDRARADQALAHAQRWEDVTVGFGIQQGHSVIEGAPPQGSDRTIGLSVSIPLPLRNKNQGRIAETRAAHDEAAARVESLQLSIRNEVAVARAEVVRLQASLDTYQRDMLPLSERNVRLAQKGYQQGLVPIVDVIQAQRQLGELDSAWLDTQDQYRQARARLDAATGAYLDPLEEIAR